MRALVTGSRGFIGQHLVQALRAQGKYSTIVGIGRTGAYRLEDVFLVRKNDYAEIDADICNHNDMQRLMRSYKPDTIFHLAGHPIIKTNDADYDYVTKVNVMGTHHLLHHAPEGCKFILASSASVYGDSISMCDEFERPSPTSVYAASKLGAEHLLQAFSKQGKVHGLTLRLVANVGPGATHGVLKDVIAKLKSDSPELELYGDEPGSIKPFMHVKDTARAILHLEERMWLYNTVYNISPADNLSVKTLAQTAMFVTDIIKPIKWLGKPSLWAGDNPIVRITNQRLVESNFRPQYHDSIGAVMAAAKELK